MNKFIKKISFLILTLVFLVACTNKASKNTSEMDKAIEQAIEDVKNEDENKNSKSLDEKEDKSLTEKKVAKLLFGGDILPHMPINDYALSYGGWESYDYSPCFSDLKEFAKDYDFFMVNNEFSVNPNMELSGYPTFNSSEDIYLSLKDMGVDVMTTANNHALDTGIDGLKSTIDAIESHDISHVGTSKDKYTPYIIKEVNGIKIAIFSYAESLNGLDFLLDTKEKEEMVNRLDSEKIKEDISEVKDKVDFIVVYPHWGVEYSSYPEEYQVELARDMIDWGADMVIGNHPHVIQPMEEYESKDGRKGIIYYSLGNLLSNQKAEAFEGDYRVEQGLLVEANIEKIGKNKANIKSSRYHSTVVDRSYDEYGTLDKTFVATPYLEDDEKASSIDEGTLYLLNLADQMNTETIENGI